MSTKRQTQKAIQVCAHWQGMAKPVVMNMLMKHCATKAQEQGTVFTYFSFQDCCPKGVSF